MLGECETLCSGHPGTLDLLRDDFEKAKRLLNGGTVYLSSPQRKSEKFMRPWRLSSLELGHWYYCINSQPVIFP